MNRPDRFLLAILVAGPLLGLGPSLRGGQAPPPKPGAEKLASLILANSFREADKLAAALMGDPALNAPALAVCGLAVLKAGRVEEAEAIFQTVLQRSPDNPEAHLGLGRVASIRNDADASITHLRRAVPSALFYDEALRFLWRAAHDRGRVDDLFEIGRLAGERYGRESRPLPALFIDGIARVRGLAGKRLFQMEGRFERIQVPLLTAGPRVSARVISLRLNAKGEYPFQIDSASAGFMTITPLLAEELGLVQTGNATSTGVGTATIATRFSMLDKVELGPVTFRNVPVMVSDIRTLRGLKGGLVGTALLKRFNATIDVEAEVMSLFPLDRPELLAADIDKAAVAADVPLYIFDQTAVVASLGGAPPALYILDSAAGTNLIDAAFFEEHIKPKIDPARIVRYGIQGAGGAQTVNHVAGLAIALGPLVFNGQAVNEFRMSALNEIPGRYASGLLGNPLLWPYRVHMDFHAGRLILEKSSQPRASLELGPPTRSWRLSPVRPVKSRG